MRNSLSFTGTVAALLLLCRSASPSPTSKIDELHWAFRPLQRPVVSHSEHAIDQLSQRALQVRGLTRSPPASRRVLIRRTTFALHGLPPTPQQIEAFVADQRPDAYERLIDRLLASPRYGERWARHWLDLVRYAESDGYNADKYRPNVWHYRDYVIRAFNEDKPYDRFIVEQLAGDTIKAAPSSDAHVATGFLRHWPLEDNGRTLPEMWQTVLNDVTDVTASVFLGLTAACARCHDHKFDAITQRDYFGMQAYFATMAPRDDIPIGQASALAVHGRRLAAWEDATADLRGRLQALEEPYWRQVEVRKAKRFPLEVQRISKIPPKERTVHERQIMRIGGHELHPNEKEVLAAMPNDAKAERTKILKELEQFNALKPAQLQRGRGVIDLIGEPPPTHIVGAREPQTQRVEPAVFAALRTESESSPSSTPASLPRRLRLARWIASPDNPLTARVMANRIWQHLFGSGLVATPSDFGVQSSPPAQPELLDWLATELVDNAWSLKTLQRTILLSKTYRQASLVAAASPGQNVDPDNRLLWRARTRRVEAEVVRDAILQTSGELETDMHGKSVFPQLPKAFSKRYGWKATADERERRRRSIYLVVKRNSHLPLLKLFDAPDSFVPCASRAETTTPTQALALLNDEWTLQRARGFAGRIIRETGATKSAWVKRAFAIAYGRTPSDDELRECLDFLCRQAATISERPAEAPVALPSGNLSGHDVKREDAAALVDLCHALWNSSEFITVD